MQNLPPTKNTSDEIEDSASSEHSIEQTGGHPKKENGDTAANLGSKKTKPEDSPTNSGSKKTKPEDSPTNSGSKKTKPEDSPTNSGCKKIKTEDSPTNSGHKKVKTEASSTVVAETEVIKTEVVTAEVATTELVKTDLVATEFVIPKAVIPKAVIPEVITPRVVIPEVVITRVVIPKVVITEASFYDQPDPEEVGAQASAKPEENGDCPEDCASPEQASNHQESSTQTVKEFLTQGDGGEEPPSPEMEKLMLEAAFERWDQKHKVQGVLSITKEKAVPKGENFLSIVTRLTVKVVLGSGRQVTKRFILKEFPKDEITRSICKNSGIFKLETNTYRIALKEMEYLMAEFGDTDDVLWCQLIKYDPFSTILLEDLTDYGFKTVKRQSCLDYDHGILAIRNIARFHAMAKVLQERGIINATENLPYSLISHPGTVKSFFYKGYEAVSKGIKKYWGKEWAEIAEKLRLPLKYLEEKMLDIGKLVENRFYVLNHGDCWSNNLMFKYDWKNKPIAVRFLDFQAPHYNSPAIDLTYFLHQSMEPSVRRSRFNELLENYYESLLLTFNKYKYTGPVFTFEELTDEMERVSFFGLSMFTIRHAVVTTDMDDAMDLEKIFLTEGEEGLNIDIYKDLALIDRMGPDLKLIVALHAT
ncbi:unnamed protein product [Nezara viridula]|uniref:CHK kinase-like domain-containing protein n=1 Tax=Nezara viridula TaxID=85310 RepID=A0A9P0HBP4_NEZVI|nr:unnamed protein product [Nezara viridula]